MVVPTSLNAKATGCNPFLSGQKAAPSGDNSVGLQIDLACFQPFLASLSQNRKGSFTLFRS
jgi:hypothetical protein